MKGLQMKMCKSLMTVSIVLALAIPASAQFSWLNLSEKNVISLEATKFTLEDDREFSFMSGVYILSGNFKVGQNLFILAEIPYASFKREASWGDLKTSMVGNPYLGLKFNVGEAGLFGYSGIRLPLAPNDESRAAEGAASIYFDRLEAFMPESKTLTFGGGFNNSLPSGLSYNIQGGITMLLFDEEYVDDETFLDYKATFNYNLSKIKLACGLTGRYRLKDTDQKVETRNVNMLGAKAGYDLGFLIPGIHFYYPLGDDMQDLYNYFYGVTIDFPLNIMK